MPSVGTCHGIGNLLKLLVTIHRVTYFILQAHTENCISYNTVKKQGRDLEKNHNEWTRKVEIRTRDKIVSCSNRQNANHSTTVL